jgi:hypothetical protein
MSTTTAKKEVQILEWITPEIVCFNANIDNEAIAYVKRHLLSLKEYWPDQRFINFYEVLIYAKRCWQGMDEKKINKKSKRAIQKWKEMMDAWDYEDWTTETVYYAWWCYFIFDDELVLEKLDKWARGDLLVETANGLAVRELIELTYEVFTNKGFIC